MDTVNKTFYNYLLIAMKLIYRVLCNLIYKRIILLTVNLYNAIMCLKN